VPNTESGRFDLLQNHEGRISKVEKDLWVGNGKPGLTTRIALVEESMEDIKGMKKSIEELKRNVYIGIGILIALEFLLKLKG
jgi:hypothetical protein